MEGFMEVKSVAKEFKQYGQQQRRIKEYFDGEAFGRWAAISTGKGNNFAQRKLIEGRQEIHDCLMEWIEPLEGKSVLDAGCGAGFLSDHFAQQGAIVKGIDISTKMIAMAKERGQKNTSFEVCDLMSEKGEYDILVSMDVLIHYSLDDMPQLLSHVLGRARERAYISFAPSTAWFRFLKVIGEKFSGSSKTTSAYLHPIQDIERILNELGYKITRKKLVSNIIYNAVLVEIYPSKN
ncbi:magnesium protoporphyrin IX methyltransferase [Heliorestis convoluta]|uniref:Magnesium protoporphyrin IX methyltransferase n=1 Tax=Heliorestis convoluta TaxID=356322 RepID=A0A5Q2N5V9_9FIRM|nr:magnesium protoporphyrin IX methyltransferase [Heliorestis convoluta]QGG48732.1 magnesium protoporphyrin O-methyltransferase [Heliorestis convoluta]